MKYCNDYGDAPGCLGTPDERYTMDFSDIGQPPILWCSFCGPRAKEFERLISEAESVRGPDFVGELEKAIKQAEKDTVKQ